ncbi:hypothetical protein PI172_2449 [Prevotella intermedia]|uniref:Uncharacterized protein n=1 Tax=Prevotella intermedia TaxID=28131 RepID=A0AAD1F8N6_PREIN|nr:hypothetical protein PI172_2449 [Prevotella intermedia]
MSDFVGVPSSHNFYSLSHSIGGRKDRMSKFIECCYKTKKAKRRMQRFAFLFRLR